MRCRKELKTGYEYGIKRTFCIYGVFITCVLCFAIYYVGDRKHYQDVS